ncbi:MAG: hypothetical protein Greene041679_609 [Parcubacteria group bacterium Greene0416_79]|nr:MAG: hypothetical protein Greene041679_609 [Parcubacteria group bacterium Greene0416_79]
MKKYRSGILIVLIIVVGALGLSFYRRVSALKANPQLAAQKIVAELVERVGKLILLPEGESPVIATVTDLEMLKGQPFFAKARAGDKVLLYQTANKAYLYTPVVNKIMEVAPITLSTVEK